MKHGNGALVPSFPGEPMDTQAITIFSSGFIIVYLPCYHNTEKALGVYLQRRQSLIRGLQGSPLENKSPKNSASASACQRDKDFMDSVHHLQEATQEPGLWQPAWRHHSLKCHIALINLPWTAVFLPLDPESDVYSLRIQREKRRVSHRSSALA